MRNIELALVESIEVLIDANVTKSLTFISFIHIFFFGSFLRGIHQVSPDGRQNLDMISMNYIDMVLKTLAFYFERLRISSFLKKIAYHEGKTPISVISYKLHQN